MNGEPAEIAALLTEHPRASTFLVGGRSRRALPGRTAGGPRRSGPGASCKIVAGDPTKVFLSRRGPSWYGRQGISIAVLSTIELMAITVNPVAPQSHRFDSRRLRELIEAAVPGVPVLDVLDPSYRRAQDLSPSIRRGRARWPHWVCLSRPLAAPPRA